MDPWPVNRVIDGHLTRHTVEEADTEIARLLQEPWLRPRLYLGQHTASLDIVGRTSTHRDGKIYATYFITL